MNDISYAVKKFRKENNLTQKDFALRANLGLRFIRELEQGKSTLRMDKVNEALHFCGYSLQVVDFNGDKVCKE